ncbi:MAG: hypothetical protein COS25_01920 [Candidatus Nealsonbacteria bacterium CG02_land_8_20_14_3_00_37_10]|uniref:Uncharacterized protein n=1 Tax=Candidatus Nealsonbacteria bacterium CG02_land_8_20_14_3_00_37_10 TaxID=1974699 RepID=A0A2M7D9D2_9BACT|nr:MAG: hypothetical protein COS25_01920 [Candidatus Nealsonbacteria bacterium CG02_land_8_20_14_3_00_37_10]
MVNKVLELRYLKNNVNDQCVPITLFVVCKNQFEKDKRVKFSEISFNNIKKWTHWGDKHTLDLLKVMPEKDNKIYHACFQGTFNITSFHIELNSNIRIFNIRLESKYEFTSKDIEDKLLEGKCPMIMINPQYVNEAEQNITKHRMVRGDPEISHFIAIHGINNGKRCFIYDCNLPHDNDEVLSEENIKCEAKFDILRKYSKDITNRLYWFELIDKSEKTNLLPY